MAETEVDERPNSTLAEETGADTPPSKLWAREIQQAEKQFEDWWKKCDQIVARYKGTGYTDMNTDGTKTKRRYNVLWSIMQTMMPLVYSVPPKPFVSRRFNDNDPVARDASMVMERAQKFSLEGNELHDALIRARDDYLLTSRGVIWAKYKPYMTLRRSEAQEGQKLPGNIELKRGEDGKYYFEYEEKVYEECDWEHVHYRDFIHGPASQWKHVPWIARRVPMTRKELVKRFGKKMGRKVPLTINNKSDHGSREEGSDEERGLFAKGEVWEIWDKTERKVYWLCPQMPKQFLDEQDDFLELDGFFPCTTPVYSTKTNESLVPTPDFCLWQDIAMELDDVTHRIKLLTEAMRVVGVYDASVGDIIKRVVTQTIDNDLIPVSGWAAFAEKGGLANTIEFLPIQDIAMTLERLYGARAQLSQELYEITGISDVVRGASDPRETAKAQQIKGQFASKRLGTKQKAMERMIDEALEIQGEIVSKHYSEDTIKMVSSAKEVLTDQTGQYQPERFKAAMNLIKSNMRQFRISIDERSLIEQGVMEDQEQRGMIMSSLSQLLGQMPQFLEMVGPQGGPLMARLLMFAIRAYPLAKSEESSIETAIQQLLANPPQPQQEEQQQTGKSPAELEIEKMKLELDKERLALEREKLAMEKWKADQQFAIDKEELVAQSANRAQESKLREDKQVADALLRDKEIELRAKDAEDRNVVDMVKHENDRQDKAREKEIDREIEYEKIDNDIAKAFAQIQQKDRSDTQRAKQQSKKSEAA